MTGDSVGVMRALVAGDPVPSVVLDVGVLCELGGRGVRQSLARSLAFRSFDLSIC